MNLIQIVKKIFKILLLTLLFTIPAVSGNLNAKGKPVDSIMTELFSGDGSRVNKILVYIARNRPAELLDRLKGVLLSKADANKKKIAVKTLKYYPYKMTLNVGIDVLEKSPSFIVKKEIIEYLKGSHKKKIVLPIAQELDSPFYSVRESAILALKAIGDDRMYPYILNMMGSKNPVHKVYALEAMFHIYDMRFYSLLIKMIKDDNKSIRYYSLKCIEKNKLRDALPHIRRTAIRDEYWEVRVKAIQILGVLPDKPSLYTLLTCLKDKNTNIRLASSESLLALKFKKSARSLSGQLAVESDDRIKRTIIDTLIKIKVPGVFKGLKKILLSEKNIMLRVRSAYALGSIRSKGAVPILLQGLKDPDPKVRAEVCNSLGNFNIKKSGTALLNMINDEQVRYVRSAALYSIKRLKKKYFILPLFDRYTIENDPIIKEKMRFVLRGFLN